MRIVIINGPNLNLLGKREPEIYGSISFEEFIPLLERGFSKVQFEFFQSNVEGDIVNKLQETGFTADGIILNAGGYTHTSVAIADAVAAIKSPVVEVHISNPYAREEFRQKSLISAKAVGVVAGFGLHSYFMAADALANRYKNLD